MAVPAEPNGVMDGMACKRPAETGRKALAERIAKEQVK